MNKIIEVKNLTFQYEKNKKIIDNLSFYVECGDLLAILGKNGCGKSTLIDCILGLNKKIEGEIFVERQNIFSLSDREKAKIVAYIFQNNNLLTDFSVRDFILLGRNPLIGLKRYTQKDYEILYNIATECKIDNLLDKSINKLSGGERQLVNLARALAQDTRLIIMDEPTAFLDFGNQQHFLKIINELNKSGKTIVFTTHNPNHVLDLDCRVAIMSEGTIKTVGKGRDVISLEILKDIYSADFISAKYYGFSL